MKGRSSMWFARFRSSPNQDTLEENQAPAVHHSAESHNFKAPVSFTNEEGRQDGHCLSISESGLLAVFDRPPQPWTDGQLVLTAPEKSIHVPVRVARVSEQDVWFYFLTENEEELAPILALIAWILNPEGTPPVEATDEPNPDSDQAILVSEVSTAG